MNDLLSILYPWTKSLHLISVISWMAGLFYLPRLFVHHTEQVSVGGKTDALFVMMEGKLLKVIMTPAMIASWLFGSLLALTPGIIDWSEIWPWLKLATVLAMSFFHVWLAAKFKLFMNGTNTMSGRTYRLMNEVPTVLMIVIVIAVIVRPF